MVVRGNSFRNSFEDFDLPSGSVLFVPEYYQDWAWVFAPPQDDLEELPVVFARAVSEQEYRELNNQLPEWTLYEFQPGSPNWHKVPLEHENNGNSR